MSRRLGVDFEAYEVDGLSWVAVSPLWKYAEYTYLFQVHFYSPFKGFEVCLDVLDSANGGPKAVDCFLDNLKIPKSDVRWVREGYCSWDRSSYAALETPPTITLAELKAEFRESIPDCLS